MVHQRKNVSQATASSGKSKAEVAKPAENEMPNEHIDIYIRMNMDNEKDYCFNVPTKQPISFLYRIFEDIPIQLHPGYFFHSRPKGFSVSVFPGYMTAEGALLFTGDSMKPKWLKHVSDDTLIGDAVVEGMLIVPEWREHFRHEFGVILFLLTWLYLDLPEFISPTPGTAPYIWLYRLASQFFRVPKEPETPSSIFSGKWWQIAFFTLHIVKTLFIYFILWNGAWNPSTLNPFKRLMQSTKPIKMPSREQLSIMGWTGTRRMAADDWPERYRNYRNERAGGLMEAFRTGLLSKPIGITLHEGEGWNALAGPGSALRVNSFKVGPDLLDAEGRFIVSPAYFTALAQPLANFLSEDKSDEEARQAIKDFRSFGYLDGPEKLVELFEHLSKTHT